MAREREDEDGQRVQHRATARQRDDFAAAVHGRTGGGLAARHAIGRARVERADADAREEQDHEHDEEDAGEGRERSEAEGVDSAEERERRDAERRERRPEATVAQ